MKKLSSPHLLRKQQAINFYVFELLKTKFKISYARNYRYAVEIIIYKFTCVHEWSSIVL